jgi:hypothetical protein
MSGLFNTKGWLRRLAGPASLCMLCLRAAAQGSFIYQHYYTANPDPNFPWDYEGQRVLMFGPVSMTIDLNQDGTADYLIGTDGAQGGRGFFIHGLADENRVMSDRPFDTTFAIALQGGETIGGTLPVGIYWSDPNVLNGTPLGSVFTASANIGSLGYYTGVESAYCGLQMQVDGQIHYGWVRVGNPIAGINGGWVYDSVFNNTPGQSLLAGSGVPEPTTVSLAILAGLILCAKRRHRC